MHSSGLPMAVTNSSRKETLETPRACQLEDEWWGGEQSQEDRAPYRSFVPKMAAPPPSQQQQRNFHGRRFTAGVDEQTLSWSERTRGNGAERAVGGGYVVEGFREGGDDSTSCPGSLGEGEGGFNVLLDGGAEERKGGMTSPPSSWRKASV